MNPKTTALLLVENTVAACLPTSNHLAKRLVKHVNIILFGIWNQKRAEMSHRTPTRPSSHRNTPASSPATVDPDEILSGNRVVINHATKASLNGELGQVQAIRKEGGGIVADVLLDRTSEIVSVPFECLANLPRRFQGILSKYSSKGMVRNWKERLIEVWASSLTYREVDSAVYLGEVPITRHTEVVSLDSSAVAASDRFTEKPHPHYLGLHNRGATFWVCCADPSVLEALQRAVQEAVNDSILLVDQDTYTKESRSSCLIS